MKLKNQKGFSLVEVMIVIALFAIIAAIAVPSFNRYYRIYKYNQYTASMENLVKWARMTAMERSVNVGLCVDSTNKTLRIINMGTNRSGICTGTTLQNLQIDDAFVTLAGSGASFDPRGFSIFTGNVCVTDNSKYYKAVVSRFGAIRIEKGAGGC